MVIVPAVLTTSVVFNLVIVEIVPTRLVVFNLVIVPTPVILRFLPTTSSYVISPVTSKLPATVIPPPTHTSVKVDTPTKVEAEETLTVVMFA